jgi:hypothetical protein
VTYGLRFDVSSTNEPTEVSLPIREDQEDKTKDAVSYLASFPASPSFHVLLRYGARSATHTWGLALGLAGGGAGTE